MLLFINKHIGIVVNQEFTAGTSMTPGTTVSGWDSHTSGLLVRHEHRFDARRRFNSSLLIDKWFQKHLVWLETHKLTNFNDIIPIKLSHSNSSLVIQSSIWQDAILTNQRPRRAFAPKARQATPGNWVILRNVAATIEIW